MRLLVCETGKLEGKFEVWVDLETSAAKALAESLAAVAAQAEELPPVHASGCVEAKQQLFHERESNRGTQFDGATGG